MNVPPPPPDEAIITYRRDIGRWQGECEYPEGGILLIWLTMETYLRYLDAYLTATYGEARLEAERDRECEAGIAHVRPMAYWRALAVATHDPEIHITRIGRQGPHGETPHEQ